MLKVKLQKSPKYSHFRILLKAAEKLGIFSIPVRVTIQRSRKQRNIAVSEFFFYTENRVCPLLVRYSDFAADILVLSCAILRKKTVRSVHRLSHSRLCGLEHMSIDVQSRSRIAMPYRTRYRDYIKTCGN